LDAETAKAESEIDEAVRDRTARIRVDVGEASLSNVRASSAAAVVVAAPLRDDGPEPAKWLFGGHWWGDA
jgi:hypothetical protein